MQGANESSPMVTVALPSVTWLRKSVHEEKTAAFVNAEKTLRDGREKPALASTDKRAENLW